LKRGARILARSYWPLLMIALGLGEFLALKFRFKALIARLLKEDVRLWVSAITRLHLRHGLVYQPMVLVGGLALVTGWQTWKKVLEETEWSPSRRYGAVVLALVGHGAGLRAFWLVTAWGREGSGIWGPGAPWLGLASLAAGLALVGGWALALWPLRVWVALVRRGAGPLTASVAASLLALTAGVYSLKFWGSLQGMTFAAVRPLLGLFSLRTICRPEVFEIGTPKFTVSISPKCSGLEGAISVVALIGAYLWLFRREMRFPRAFLLFPVAVVLIWYANVVRIATLILIGSWWSSRVAVDGFHSFAGWIGLCAVGFGLILIDRRLQFAWQGAGVSPGIAVAPALPAHHDATPAYVIPLMAVIATTMLTGIFAVGFDTYYPARVVVALIALWCLPLDRGRPVAATNPGIRSWWPAAALGAIVFAVWMALEPRGPAALARGVALHDGWAALPPLWGAVWLVARVLGPVLTVPVVEERAFRGFLMRRLGAEDFDAAGPRSAPWWAVLVSSVLFGAMHQRWLAGTLAGLLFAWAYRLRGRLSDAVVAHGLTNALIAVWVLTRGDWSLWA
jgi:exosortase E/protease (VPEID-CTERM system)